jgi:Resolvase, N terminal domain
MIHPTGSGPNLVCESQDLRHKIRPFSAASPSHKGGVNYGYALVSTDGQSLHPQVRQLTKAGCRKVFRETASGAKADRHQVRAALDRLAASNVLMVTRLDQLARSTRDLLNTLRRLLTARRASVRWPTLGPTARQHTGGGC